jgi:predicted RND superfamily exporter protein
MIQRLAESITRRRSWWAAGSLAILLLSLILASRLTLRHEATDFQPRGPDRDSGSAFTPGGADRIVIVLESDQTIRVEAAGPIIDRIAGAVRPLPGVRRVDGRLSDEYRQFVESEAPRYLLLFFPPPVLEDIGFRLSREGIERGLLQKGEAAGRSEMADAVGAARTDPLGVLAPALRILQPMGGSTNVRVVDGYFAVPDRKIFFLTVEPEQSLAGVESARALVDAIEAVLDQVRRDELLRPKLAGIRIFAVGRPVAYVQGFEVAVSDARRVSLASAVTVLFLLMLFLRRPLAPLFIAGTVLFGLVLTGATAFLIFGSVSLVGWLFIAVLVGLGDEFALYIVSHYWVSGDAAGSRTEALASALRRPGPGILLGGLTSAAAFFSLTAMSYPVMVQLGWITALGLVILLATSFTVLPLALSFTRPAQVSQSAWYRWTGLADALGRWPRRSLAIWLIAIAGGLWCARAVRFEPHPWKVVVRGHPATAELDRIQRRLGASFTPIVMLSKGRTAEEALERDRAATQAMDRIWPFAGVAATVSLSRWLPAREQQAENIAYVRTRPGLFSPDRFRRDFLETTARSETPDSVLVTNYLPLVTRFINPEPETLTLDDLRRLGQGDMIDRHLVREGGEYVVMSYVYLTQLPWAEGALDRFARAVAERGGPPLAAVRFSGDAVRGATHTSTLKRDILRATAIALGLVGIVLVGRFRRLTLIGLCLVPLVAGLSATLGIMGLLGIELNILTLAIAPLLIGLGVDDGIHMVDRLARGETPSQVIRETGPPMTITTLTTIAGFACLGLATFRGVRELGLVAAFGLVICLLASLHLVPVCHSFLSRKKP